MRNQYEWLFVGSFDDVDTFKTLTNWLSGEFELNLQEEEEKGLTVFFPHGFFYLNQLESNSNSDKFEIRVEDYSCESHSIRECESMIQSNQCKLEDVRELFELERGNAEKEFKIMQIEKVEEVIFYLDEEWFHLINPLFAVK